jgi:hypothetical protein
VIDKELGIVIKEIKAKRAQLAETLSRGDAKEYAEYRYLVGYNQGLLSAQTYLEALAKGMEEDDE